MWWYGSKIKILTFYINNLYMIANCILKLKGLYLLIILMFYSEYNINIYYNNIAFKYSLYYNYNMSLLYYHQIYLDRLPKNVC